jgi:putative Mn2+ efflux pump MntP
MNIASTALLALAMSTDAFAAATAKGAALRHPHWSEAVRTGLIFGTIEAATPVIGWLVGSAASRHVAAYGPWIAFVVLVGLGLHMAWAGLKGDDGDADANADDGAERPGRKRHSFLALALTGFATSIDAMAVGLGLAFVDVNIVQVALAIGFTTFAAVTAGVMLGRWLGSLIGRYAEVAGGVVLAGIGGAILYQHLAAAG